MGTGWRGLLAPVNQPTDDRRRFKTFTHRVLPLGLKWQREDRPAHEDAVVVGSLEAVNIGTLAEAVESGWISKEQADKAGIDPSAQGVWGAGKLFDDVDAAAMPRLAEDVAEAKHMLMERVVAPSVDPIPQGAMFMVEPGEDEPVTEERFNEMMQQAMETGHEPVLELLFEEGLIGAATLVVTPAFSECRPFELLVDAEAEPAEAESAEADDPASAAVVVAALTAAAPTIPAGWFDDPGLSEPTPITVTDDGRIFGHAAAWGTCHAEFRDVCVAAPHTASGYAHFHRHTVDTDGGVLAAGRLTTGHGKLGTGCTCCRGKDDHACTRASLSAAVAHYDQARTLAYVRAGEDEHGIWLAGAAVADLDEQDRAVLARRLVSGDWREVGGNLELVEVLALATERPGFPLPRTSMSAGRQRALVAAGAVRPAPTSPRLAIDYRLLGREVAAALRATAGTSAAFTAPTPDPDPLPEPPDDGRAGQVAALAAEVEAAAAEDRARQAAALAAELAGVA